DLDGLQWQPARAAAPQAGQVRLRVLASGLNFRDVLQALDLDDEAAALGSECAGIVLEAGAGVALRAGDLVHGLARGALAEELVTEASLLVPIPRGLDPVVGAPAPVAWLTADHAFNCVGLRVGESVLVHSAAGGVGIAAVRLAQSLGAEVLATAHPDKHDVVRSLGVRNVFSSRDISFVDGVRAATGGRGVDVVVSALTGEAVPASLGLLPAGGRFVEIGRREAWTEAQARERFPHVRFVRFDLADVARAGPDRLRARLESISTALAEGR